MSIRRMMGRLELFEWVGMAASLLAMWVFFAYGNRLDQTVGEAGYHWHMLAVIAGIYGQFIPWAVLIGVAVLLLMTIWAQGAKAQFVRQASFGLRVFLSYCVLLIVFREVNFYIPAIHPGLRDAVLQAMDKKMLFGREAADWLTPLIHPWLTLCLKGAYVSWFWLLFVTILVLVMKDRRVVSEYLFASLVTFYMGYLCYVLVPVVGPGYTLHESITLGGMAPQFTTDRLLLPRDCFPSLHTALSVLMVIYVWRHQRKWTWLYIPLAVLIVFSTLYLRFHYATDDLAGAALAVVMGSFAPVCYSWWESLRVGWVETADRAAVDRGLTQTHA